MLSSEGFNMAWTQYEGYMVEKLNLLIAGTVDEHVTETKNLLLKYARDPDRAAYFNYASMAHNNHFFFSGLSPTSVEIPSQLLADIETAFSSLDSFKETFIATASAMFGPGFVWLVKDMFHGRLYVLPTYLAGSPYPGAHYRRQAVDMNTRSFLPELLPVIGGNGKMPAWVSIQQEDAQRRAEEQKKPKGGINVLPMLCVNTWEHVWLRDYGVGGKDEYLRRWWERIDWKVVFHMTDQYPMT